MKYLVLRRILLVALACGFFQSVSAQSITNFTSDLDQFGVHIPGILCKTRTNNDASVRNLAHGVWNRDSSEAVALNCGWPAPKPWVSNNFNDARVSGEIYARFVRTAGTPLARANETSCTVSISIGIDTAQNPNTNGVTFGTIDPNFYQAVEIDEDRADGIQTNGIAYPTGANADYFMSAFCLIPQGVRVQFFVMNPMIIQDFDGTPASP